MKFKLIATSTAADGETVYLYEGENGNTIKFQADPNEAWCWLFYAKQTTANKKTQDRLITAFIQAGSTADGDETIFEDVIKELEV